MTLHYSKTTNGFYDSAINMAMPSDAVEISADTHAALLASQSAGQVIQPDQNGNPQAVSAASLRTLGQAQDLQVNLLESAYAAAITQPVAFTTAAGQTQTFDADAAAQGNLLIATQGYGLVGSTPAGFYWVAVDNAQVPFTLEDLKVLYAAMLAQGWTAFQNLQAKKQSVRAAMTIEAAQAVTF